MGAWGVACAPVPRGAWSSKDPVGVGTGGRAGPVRVCAHAAVLEYARGLCRAGCSHAER